MSLLLRTYLMSNVVYMLGSISLLLGTAAAEGLTCGPSGGNCGLGLCCSQSGYCGPTSDYCAADTCQPSYGSCTAATAPSCSGTSASNGRRVGYYQSVAASGRVCENIAPSQINTTGLTHLLYAFVGFDSSSFAITPATSDLYGQFTALQSSTLQTWISVGGGSFGGGPWTTMASNSANRGQFISSLQSFLQNNKFQGVDLDWEFPAGDGSDAQNLVSLAQEMKAAFAGQYGISATLPVDKGTVIGFDIDGLSRSVDFFNYMAYDLHSWNPSGPSSQTIGYQASVTDIQAEMLYIWANHTNPAQVNLGIPYYGRGYTLSDPSCNTVAASCQASGPSEPGSCLQDTTGVMSLYEIDQTIAQNGATVSLDSTAMQKVATWGQNQWISYDDADTVALKAKWADTQCLGGLAFWSEDFNSGAGS